MASSIYGSEYGFLSVDSQFRIAEANRALERAAVLKLDVPNDRRTQELTAEFLAALGDEDPDTDKLVRFIVDARARASASSVDARLLAARETYESFFAGSVAANVPGWSDDLISVAEDLYVSPPLEIAISVWVADRTAERKIRTSPAVRPALLEFDHRLLGLDKYAKLSERLGPTEPFFEVTSPIFGFAVCGVLDAYMVLDSKTVDSYAAELAAFYRSNWPEASELIADVDPPIANRPLGFRAIPFAAEAFARHLTVEEGAEVVFDQLAAIDNEEDDSGIAEPGFLEYLAEVIRTGSLSSPATFEATGYTRLALELRRGLHASYLTRDNIFDAWIKHVDHGKALGIGVKDVAAKCREIRTAFESRCRGAFFTATFLRDAITLLESETAPSEIVTRLEYVYRTSLTTHESKRVIRVGGPNSPAVLLDRSSR